MDSLENLRQDYESEGIDEASLAPSPTRQLEAWLNEAIAAGHPEPNAMALATCGDGPAVRIVLLKGLDDLGLVFYTNYESDKGRDLTVNPRASVCFFWVLLARQVRVMGAVTRVDRKQSEDYFRSRPRASQLGAWASDQSRVVATRAELEQRYSAIEARFGSDPIACPEHWGGYRLAPERVEFWQGRQSRLHDRIRYDKSPDGRWDKRRLCP